MWQCWLWKFSLLGFHVAPFSHFSFYSFLGYFSSISDVGSCPSSWPLDAGRPQGLDEASLLFSLSIWVSQSSFKACDTEAAISRQSPLSTRPLSIYNWVPTRLHKWNRSKLSLLLCPSYHPHSHTYCSSSRFPPFTNNTTFYLVTKADIPEVISACLTLTCNPSPCSIYSRLWSRPLWQPQSSSPLAYMSTIVSLALPPAVFQIILDIVAIVILENIHQIT